MAERIIVNTGLKEYEIEFADRNVVSIIRFNPSDPDLAVRFTDMQDRVNDRLKELTDIELDEDGNAKDLSFVDNIREINKLIYEELDRAFGNKVSDTVFQFCNPMASINGKYFIIQFIEAITPLIKSDIKKESDSLKKHLAKYKK